MKKKTRFFQTKGNLPMRYVLLLTVAFFTITSVIALWVVDIKLKPTFMRYADSQTKKIATLVINEAVKQKATLDINQIIEIIPRDNAETSVQFDTEKINQILTETTEAVQANIREAEAGNLSELEKLTDVELIRSKKKGIVYSVPLGLATKNTLLANYGPKIPIEFSVLGDVETNVKPVIENYGINNAFIKVLIEVKVNVQIIAPFSSKITTVKTDVPVAMGMIQGKVPTYYNIGGNNSLIPQIESNKN